jgi:hypothetical protein
MKPFNRKNKKQTTNTPQNQRTTNPAQNQRAIEQANNKRIRELERIARKKPRAFKKIRNWAMLGALAGAMGASQGPAIRQHHDATQSSMRKGVELTQSAGLPIHQRIRNNFRQNDKPKVVVGERMFSGTDAQGRTHIGKSEVGLQTARTYRPRFEASRETAKQSGKGALYGAGGGALFGLFKFFTTRRKYKKKMRRAVEEK